MINLTFKEASDKVVVERLMKRRDSIVAGLTDTMTQMMYELLRRVQQKLSGEVLQPRSHGGGLLGSARVEPVENLGDKIIGRVTAGGGLASIYPHVQEYGGEKQYDIYPRNKKALAFFPTGGITSSFGGSIITRVVGGATYTGLPVQETLFSSAGRRLLFKLGKRRGSLRREKLGEFNRLGGIVVKHVVHPPLPERSYMRSAEAELQERIVEQIRFRLAQELS